LQLPDDAPLPRHYLIRQYLQKLILGRALKPGDQTPTELELMSMFGVSRITVRHAIAHLVTSGALVTRPGRGTFVATPRIQQDLRKLTGFVEDMEALGLRSSATVARVEKVKASLYVAEKLQVPEGTLVTYLERVRLAEDEPLSFDETYLPADIGDRVASENLEANPVFSLLENKYGIKLAEAEYVIEASQAIQKVARHLRIKVGAPILLIERTTYSTDRRPIDFEKLHYRGDKIRYRTLLRR
jgi:GntR family transcriptional regulator